MGPHLDFHPVVIIDSNRKISQPIMECSMKRIGQLMEELGFRKEASDSVKEAFIKHLIRASEGVSVMTPSEQREIAENPNRIKVLPQPTRPAGEQLSFDFAAAEVTEILQKQAKG